MTYIFHDFDSREKFISWQHNIDLHKHLYKEFKPKGAKQFSFTVEKKQKKIFCIRFFSFNNA